MLLHPKKAKLLQPYGYNRRPSPSLVFHRSRTSHTKRRAFIAISMNTFLIHDVDHPVLSVLSTIIRRLGVTSMQIFSSAGFDHIIHGVMLGREILVFYCNVHENIPDCGS